MTYGSVSGTAADSASRRLISTPHEGANVLRVSAYFTPTRARLARHWSPRRHFLRGEAHMTFRARRRPSRPPRCRTVSTGRRGTVAGLHRNIAGATSRLDTGDRRDRSGPRSASRRHFTTHCAQQSYKCSTATLLPRRKAVPWHGRNVTKRPSAGDGKSTLLRKRRWRVAVSHFHHSVLILIVSQCRGPKRPAAAEMMPDTADADFSIYATQSFSEDMPTIAYLQPEISKYGCTEWLAAVTAR